MKILKLTTGILIMLMISSSMVFSQTNKTTTNQNDKTVKTASVNDDPNFVDKNHDGICDKHQNTQNKQVQGCNFVDKNNDGICDNCGKTKAKCIENQKNCKGKGCTSSHGKCCGKGNNPTHN